MGIIIKLLNSLPFPLSKKSRRIKLKKIVKNVIKLFKELKLVDDLTKRRLLHKALQFSMPFAWWSNVMEVIESISIVLTGSLMFLLFYELSASLFGVPHHYMDFIFNANIKILLPFIYAIPIVVIIFIVFTTSRTILLKYWISADFNRINYVWLLGVSIISFLMAILSSDLNETLSKTFWIVEIFYFALLVALMFYGIIITTSRRVIFRRIARANLFYELLYTIHHREKYQNYYDRHNYRQSSVMQLEDIFNIIQRDLPHHINPKDIQTHQWAHNYFDKVAFAIRDLKKLIFVPSKTTDETINKKLTNMLICILENKWDELEQVDITITDMPSNSINIAQIIKSVIIASIPIILLWVFYDSILKFPGNISIYVKIGTLAWAVLCLALGLDPLIGKKLAHFKEVLQVMPFGGKEEKFD
jgi:hypothetical protein